jgi:hypothetical protein
MTSVPDKDKLSRVEMLDKLLYARPLDKDLQVIDSLLTEVLQRSNKQPLPELAEFLDRWQFRVEIAQLVQEAEDSELDEEEEIPQNWPLE